jgi:hypothetical protein
MDKEKKRRPKMETPAPPVRVRLRRTKGWRKPPNTVVVSKPTMWGNPFWKGYGCRLTAAWSYEVALKTELLAMRLGLTALDARMRRVAERLHELRGKNLACWCPLDQPKGYCHADVLLDLANGQAVEAVEEAETKTS